MNDQPSNSSLAYGSHREDHPSGGDLYDFFSTMPRSLLTTSKRGYIAYHILVCPECAAFGELIEEDDENMPTLTDAVLDHAAAQKAIGLFRRTLARFQEGMEGRSVTKEDPSSRMFTLGGEKVDAEDSMLALAAATSAVASGQPIGEDQPVLRYACKSKREVVFVATEDFARAVLYLGEQVLFEERDWLDRNEKKLPADSVVEDPESEIWEFKEGLMFCLWVSKP